jgi:uncharacterized DUF497 family protein
VEFEWDEAKASSNLRKHGIAFSLATRVFKDIRRLEWPDEDPDIEEARWLTVGLIASVEIVVVYAVRSEKIRLISARRAERDEREEYWQDR